MGGQGPRHTLLHEGLLLAAHHSRSQNRTFSPPASPPPPPSLTMWSGWNWPAQPRRGSQAMLDRDLLAVSPTRRSTQHPCLLLRDSSQPQAWPPAQWRIRNWFQTREKNGLKTMVTGLTSQVPNTMSGALSGPRVHRRGHALGLQSRSHRVRGRASSMLLQQGSATPLL